MSPVTTPALEVRIIGPGRAGQSFAQAFDRSGVKVELLGRDAAVDRALDDVDAVLICTPDRAIAQVAASVQPAVSGEAGSSSLSRVQPGSAIRAHRSAVLLHCSGATGLDSLAPHARVGSLHPLMSLPDPDTGASRLTNRGWFAVAGDPVTVRLVEALGGRSFAVPDENRALYHGIAAIAANHLVALLGQVERLAGQAQLPVEAFFDLAAGSFADVVAMGATAALTGPAARGDQATLAAHRDALPVDELDLYNALVDATTRLASQPLD